MKTLKAGTLIMITNLVYFIIYNTYFGWNNLPINKSELICDIIYKTISNIALIIIMIPLAFIYINAVKKYDKEKI